MEEMMEEGNVKNEQEEEKEGTGGGRGEYYKLSDF